MKSQNQNQNQSLQNLRRNNLDYEGITNILKEYDLLISNLVVKDDYLYDELVCFFIKNQRYYIYKGYSQKNFEMVKASCHAFQKCYQIKNEDDLKEILDSKINKNKMSK